MRTDFYRKLGIYVHIPFCLSRCFYCDFNSYSGMEDQIVPYFQVLMRELRILDTLGARMSFQSCDTTGFIKKNELMESTPSAREDFCEKTVSDGGGRAVDTVFFGGGTPSYVESAYIEKILMKIRSAAVEPDLKRLENADPTKWECTIEANPGTVNEAKLKVYKQAGVNRLSFGLQSTHTHHLEMLGRIHRLEEFEKSLAAARNCGFENISADLIFGFPGQTIQEWEQTLEYVIKSGVQHLSCYSLSVEEGTPLYKAIKGGELAEPDEEIDRDMYHFVCNYLGSAGLQQYEISNFARPGYECRHNLKYWTGQEYLGFGAGAHSYFENKRFANFASILDYCNSIKSLDIHKRYAQSELIDDDLREKEYIILYLRLTKGIDTAAFEHIFHCNIFSKYVSQLSKLLNAGLIEVIVPSNKQSKIVLTKKGLDFANAVFVEFI